MKKLILTLALLAFATSAMAVTTLNSTGQTLTENGATFKTSTSVTVKVLSDAISYAATSQHASADPAKGGAQYGSTSNDSLMTPAAAVDSGPSDPTSTTEHGLTAM